MIIKRLIKLEEKYNIKNELYAVLGLDNKTGSIKDITVEQMLLSYQKEGKLKDGTTIIEATSGNTGISLAYYHKKFNYHCVIIMPQSMSKERREMISSYGAELVLINGGMAECEEYAITLSKKIENSFVFSQFDSLYNPLAHYQVTGPFIFNSIKDINYLFSGIGTGGTISGTGGYLKDNIKDFKVIGIEPKESPLLNEGWSNQHLIQGIGANFIPKCLNTKLLDEVIDVKGEESIMISKEIRKEESLDIGISSGAALLGALEYFKKYNVEGAKAVIIFPDKGDRYTW